jgi:hypothetical protein
MASTATPIPTSVVEDDLLVASDCLRDDERAQEGWGEQEEDGA